MPDGIELAKAYVQIVPSAEGIQGKITEALGGEPAAAGDAAGQSLGAQLVGTLKKVIAAAGIGKIISESINLGGALQQSLGGVETLFGAGGRTIEEYAQSVGKSVEDVRDKYEILMKSQQTVMDNAAQAYKTVGLSANDYMEQTTSFAASLLSSVSQDTQAAADLANMAMVDMADNSNKMGTSMQDIQNAYQGFAKQNYTMLDNLKLGYGGTQAEMQRLLKDAEKISGVKYDLGNLADMYSAIHVIQQEMDITGTTAKEASTTLTGSFAAMKAAAENVLADWSTGADLTAPLQGLVETAQTFLVGNLLPMIGNVLAGIPELVYTLVPEILQSGTQLVTSLAEGFTQGIPDFLSNALPQLLQFTEELRANAGQFVDAGLNLITQLLNGLIAGLPDLIAYVPDIIINICGIINDNMPKILGEGVAIIVQLVAGIVKAVPDLLANWKKILQAVLSVISAINWLNIGKTILTGVANGVKSMGSSLLNAFKGGFSSALAWIKSLPSQAVQWGKNLIQSFINGLTGKGGAVGAGAIAATAGATIAKTASGNDWSSVWADANADVADSAQSMAEVVVPVYTKSGDAATKAAKKTKAAAQAAETLLWSLQDAGHTDTTNALGKVTIQTTELTEHLRKGSEEYDRLTRTVTESGKEMVNGVVKNYKAVTKYVTDHGKTTAQTQKTYEEIAATVRDTVTSTFDSVVDGVRTSTQTVTETLTDETKQQKQIITETCTDIVNGMLVTKEKVTTIAADGAKTTTENIKKASADSFSGLLKGWQEEADKGILGTFDTLVAAIKKQDWQSVGEWVLSTLYTGLAPEAKQWIDKLGTSLIQQINGVLLKGVQGVSQGAWNLGGQIAQGVTSGFGSIVDQAGSLAQILTSTFASLKAPLGAAAASISTALSGGLLSAFPAIYSALGALISTIGSAFVGMLQAIGAALLPTGIGTPQGIAMIAAGAALVAAIAAITAGLGIAFYKKHHSTGTGSGGSSSGSTIGASGTLWDYEQPRSLPQRTQRPNIEVNQYIYSKAQTAADLMREAQYEQRRAVLQGV
nr:MAG TPA: tail tape measure protein [Caudoviricetes sp.]